MAVRVDVYSRHDAYIGTIPADELLSFVHTDELNGEDSVAIQTYFRLCEGYRLVWRDPQGTCHEHVCQDPRGLHEGGRTVYSDTALNSICELFGDYLEDKRPYGYSYQRALEVALAPTRWAVSTVDQPGTVSAGLTFYHVSAREALNAILECGGELETVITVGTGGVTGRSIGIRAHRGSTSGHRRFAYGKDVTGISKTEHWGAITACYGYGKGVETDSGGYGRKLTFGGINGGLNYVYDGDALKLYGRPDGGGGYAHVFGTYENSDCEDAGQLLSETRSYLEEHKVPGVTYTADVLDLVRFGRQWEGVSVGDDVQVVDTEYDPELRLEGRVSKLVRNCLNGAMEVTLGNVTETMADMWIAQRQAVSSLSKRSGNWDVAASTPAAYLQQLMDGLNERFNTLGMSYRYDSFEKGTIYSSVPMDEDGNPTKTGGWAMQLCSRGFRIASGTKADGSWNWTTFGTGEGFTASLLNAGVIRGGANYWNLETGDLYFKQGSIRSKNGLSVWDLTNNSFTTRNMTANYMTANNITAKGTFECGGTYGIKLNGTGQLAGFRNGSQVGYIDYSSSMRDVSTGEIRYGIQMQCQGSLRISTPKTSIAATSDTSVTATYGYTGDHQLHYISKIESNGDGSITWWNASRSISFINGFCTYCGFD